MKIKSLVSKLPLNGIELKIDLHNYPSIDHKDPSTRDQLRIYRDLGKINFVEILEGDKEELTAKEQAKKNAKAIKKIHAENKKKILAAEKANAEKLAKEKTNVDVRGSDKESKKPKREKGSN